MRRKPLQVNLDPSTADQVYRLAEKDGVPVAAILRESVEEYLWKRGTNWDALDQLIGSIKGGPHTDVANDLDEVLAEAMDEILQEAEERFRARPSG